MVDRGRLVWPRGIQEVAQIEGCGRSRRQSVFTSLDERSPPAASATAPGSTIATPPLQNDIIRLALPPTRAVDPACSDISLLDTKLDEIDRRDSLSRAPSVASWVETWTFWVCGKVVGHRVTLTPEGKATGIVVSPTDLPMRP